MTSTIDIHMSVRSSQILYRINSTVDQKLGPKRNTCHSNGTSCCRNCSAGGKIAGCTAALCTVAVCGQCKSFQDMFPDWKNRESDVSAEASSVSSEAVSSLETSSETSSWELSSETSSELPDCTSSASSSSSTTMSVLVELLEDSVVSSSGS